MLSIRSLPCALRRTTVVVVIAVLTPAAGRAAPAAVTHTAGRTADRAQWHREGRLWQCAGRCDGACSRGRRSAISDGDGRFRINDLPPGEYTLRATHIGYSDAALTVTARTGESAAADIVMEASAVALAGITVYGELTRGQARALNEQKTSPNLKYVIDEELFQVTEHGGSAHDPRLA